jgi:hypothetical protein
VTILRRNDVMRDAGIEIEPEIGIEVEHACVRSRAEQGRVVRRGLGYGFASKGIDFL